MWIKILLLSVLAAVILRWVKKQNSSDAFISIRPFWIKPVNVTRVCCFFSLSLHNFPSKSAALFLCPQMTCKLGCCPRSLPFSDLLNPITYWFLPYLPSWPFCLCSASFARLLTFRTLSVLAGTAHPPLALPLSPHCQLCLHCCQRGLPKIHASLSFRPQNLWKIPCFLPHISLDSSLWHKRLSIIQLLITSPTYLSAAAAFSSIHIISAKLKFLKFLENAM